jgi:hypothetical protein
MSIIFKGVLCKLLQLRRIATICHHEARWGRAYKKDAFAGHDKKFDRDLK